MALEDAPFTESGPPAGIPLPAGDERLPCGRPLSRVWEQARDGFASDPHTADCPYCRQAVDGLAALERATRALRAQERPTGQTLADRVMRAVRDEVRLGRMLPLDDPAQDLRIAETAAANVLRRAADSVPGARAVSCRLALGEDCTTVHVTMTLAAALDQPLPDRAALVREAVLHAADRTLGLAVTNVDLEVVAVLEPPRPADSGSPSGETIAEEGEER
ncbi:hypothetical protein OG607_06110 [Streptomyces sp. NBC_01537]|uniref:hypothetical protein n=1 Tax=Streptomyces sp. NBC_01537 TaxID=2903896 RepID=UPI00386F26C6